MTKLTGRIIMYFIFYKEVMRSLNVITSFAIFLTTFVGLGSQLSTPVVADSKADYISEFNGLFGIDSDELINFTEIDEVNVLVRDELNVSEFYRSNNMIASDNQLEVRNTNVRVSLADRFSDNRENVSNVLNIVTEGSDLNSVVELYSKLQVVSAVELSAENIHGAEADEILNAVENYSFENNSVFTKAQQKTELVTIENEFSQIKRNIDGTRSDLMLYKNTTNQDLQDIVNELANTDTFAFGDFEVIRMDTDRMNAFLNMSYLFDQDLNLEPINIMRKQWTSNAGRATSSEYDAVNYHAHLEAIGMPEAWEALGGCASDSDCGGSSDVTVAILDTGVAHTDTDFDAGSDYTVYYGDGFEDEVYAVPGNTNQGTFNEGLDQQYSIAPDLASVNFVAPKDIFAEYQCQLRSADGSIPDCNSFELAKIDQAQDDDGHGTYIANIIAAAADNANNNVGIAHNVNIVPVDVMIPNNTLFCLDSDGLAYNTCGTDDDIRGLTWDLLVADGITHAVENGNADVINLSLGGPGATDPALEAVIDEVTAKGVVVVAASGNFAELEATFGPLGVSAPANSDNVIAVGATNSDNTRSSYSQYGSTLDFVAPVGDDTTGLIFGSQWFACSDAANCQDQTDPFTTFSSSTTLEEAAGTSFSAPQVAAVVALMKSVDKSLNHDEVVGLLSATAVDLGDAGRDDQFGHGLIQADQVVARLQDRQKIFTWYDTSRSGRSAWNLIANPSDSETVNVTLRIKGQDIESFALAPNEQVQKLTSSLQGGPVIIYADGPVIATQRVLFNGSFNEYSSIDNSDLATDFIFTWNDTSRDGRNAWNLVGNPGDTVANVTISIDGNQVEAFTLEPGEQVQKQYADLQAGPVEVSSDVPVYATQRVLFNGSFNEYSAIDTSDLNNEYYYTWYDTSREGRSAWLLFGNPTGSSVDVEVYIAGELTDTVTLAAGEQVQKEYRDIQGGPVRISATGNIYTTQRVLFNGSFNEYPGINSSNLTTDYYFTWADNSQSSRRAWTLIGNPNGTSVDVEISYIGTVRETATIEAGEQYLVLYDGESGGPVELSATGNIYTTQRVLFNDSFNEYEGIPLN